MDLPKISVIICSYNREQYIMMALQSLYKQDWDLNSFEVLVVDNNSTDNTKSVCQNFIHTHPELAIQYITESQQGSSFARNKGAALAKGEILVFMDDDAVAELDFISNINRFYKDHPQATGLGGRITPLYIPKEPNWMSHFVSSLVGNFHYSEITKEFGEGKYPLESNMAVKKIAFDEIGGFNSALPGVKGKLRIGGEGKDFFYKLIDKGAKIYYDPSVKVQHIVETDKLTREYMYRVASGIGRGERIRISNQGSWGLILKNLEYGFKLGAAIVLGILYTLQGKPQKALPVIHFRIDALKGLNEKSS